MKNIFAVSVLGIAAMANTDASGADWSDTSMNLNFGSRYRSPGLGVDVTKAVLELSHVSGYKYGSNFFEIVMLKSHAEDPAAGTGRADGALEAYLVYRNQLSLGAFGTSMAFGPVRDLSLTSGFDLGTKNTSFAPRPMKLLLGPTLNFTVENGFFDVSLLAYHETNYNGIVGTSVNFDNTYQLATAWNKKFTLAAPLVFKGYAFHTGAKGKNGFGAQTAAETVVHALLMVDLGALAGGKGRVYAGMGIDYIRNKFGERGVDQSTPIAQLEVHF